MKHEPIAKRPPPAYKRGLTEYDLGSALQPFSRPFVVHASEFPSEPPKMEISQADWAALVWRNPW